MKNAFLFAVLCSGLVTGCSNAQFSGGAQRAAQSETTPQPATTTPVVPTPPATTPVVAAPVSKATATATATAVATAPTTTQTTDNLPAACENTVSTTGVHDAASGFTYKLLPQPLAYNDAVTQCAAEGASGLLIAAGQDLPDAVLACKAALGTLWLRPAAGAGLWQPNVTGTDDPATPHWIICYYQ